MAWYSILNELKSEVREMGIYVNPGNSGFQDICRKNYIELY